MTLLFHHTILALVSRSGLPTFIPTPPSIASLPSLASVPPLSLSCKNPSRKLIFLSKSKFFTVSETTDFDATVPDFGDDGGEEGLSGSPWEGAVVYRRDASVLHLEYCTTLERLGLPKLSSEVSRSRAAAMGIRLPARRAKDANFGDQDTPVLVSIDVTRRRRRLKLDGIVRTVITLRCNRCTEPAAECVFSNFSLLLTEDPIEESDEINMGTIFGEDKFKNRTIESDEEDDEQDIDLDDQLYFPAEEKEIDISKNIRDIVHLEITINSICNSSCKGLCLRCGTNLNKNSCNCSKIAAQDKAKEYGPLSGLRKQMQQQ